MVVVLAGFGSSGPRGFEKWVQKGWAIESRRLVEGNCYYWNEGFWALKWVLWEVEGLVIIVKEVEYE